MIISKSLRLILRSSLRSSSVQLHKTKILAPYLHHQSEFLGLNVLNFPKSLYSTEETKGQEEEEGNSEAKKSIDPEKDRTKVIPVEVSIRYLQSQPYKDTYGDQPVWVPYRRNFKGQFAPKKTRKSCIRKGEIITGNPCPICRDEFLVIDYRNSELLKQFISPFNGEILHWDKTGLCRTTQFKLLLAIEKAKDYGTITFDSVFREYNYENYYPKEALNELKKHNLL